MLGTLRRTLRLVRPLRSRPLAENPLTCLPELDPSEEESIWRRVQQHTMTGKRRVAALIRSIAHVEENGVPGDIVECGVWRGGSMMAAALALLRRGSTGRRLFLFDTFAGMPPPGEKDRDLQGCPASELLAQSERATSPVWAWCPLWAVQDAMAGTGYPRERTVFAAGRVEATVPLLAPKSIALLRLDTDWYESTRHELECLFPRLSEGGVLIVDDYGHWQGARRAVDEYFAEQQLNLPLEKIDYTGRLVIKKRMAS